MRTLLLVAIAFVVIGAVGAGTVSIIPSSPEAGSPPQSSRGEERPASFFVQGVRSAGVALWRVEGLGGSFQVEMEGTIRKGVLFQADLFLVGPDGRLVPVVLGNNVARSLDEAYFNVQATTVRSPEPEGEPVVVQFVPLASSAPVDALLVLVWAGGLSDLSLRLEPESEDMRFVALHEGSDVATYRQQDFDDGVGFGTFAWSTHVGSLRGVGGEQSLIGWVDYVRGDVGRGELRYSDGGQVQRFPMHIPSQPNCLKSLEMGRIRFAGEAPAAFELAYAGDGAMFLGVTVASIPRGLVEHPLWDVDPLDLGTCAS